jgi:type I protein arginine methyltransferase
MLDTVLEARDKYLVPGGSVLPDKSAIYVVGVSDIHSYDSHVNYWKDVYSFDLTPMQEPVLSECVVTVLPGDVVCTTPATLVNLDMNTCKVENLVFDAPFTVTVNSKNKLTGMVILNSMH